MGQKIIITIDGPAGSGKTSVAKEVAKRLGLLYLDTGAMYRAMTLKALTAGITSEQEDKLIEMAQRTDLRVGKPANVSMAGEPIRQSSLTRQRSSGGSGGVMRIWLDGKEVTDKIRTEEVTNNIWWVCRVKAVREKMKKIQREIGSRGGIVIEGRDIGTVIFPDAPFKFYLDASINERAKRRWLEQTNKGMQSSDMEKLRQDIQKRDKSDMEREIAPLKKAEDAVHVDTTNLSIDEVVDKIIVYVKKEKV